MTNAVDVAALQDGLLRAGYVADRGLATALACAVTLERAVLLEGDAGVGKTDAARALTTVFGAELLRLQCYEGLDLAAAAYDWNYGKQLLAIRAALGATRPRGIVLLIDEIDRADDEFEAFLLEFLADYAISIPERGTVAAAHPPIVVLSSNRTRDLHDALKRRCFYHWIGHPSVERETEIVRLHLPDVRPALAADVARAAAALRERGLRKAPGIAESLDWAQTLQMLGAERLALDVFEPSLGSVLKYPEDLETARAAAAAIVAAGRGEPGA